MDIPEVQARWPQVHQALADRGIEAHAISAATGENTQKLLQRVAALLSELPPPEPSPPSLTVLIPEDEKAFSIERTGDGWVVHGKHIERAAAMTNWDYYEAILRFQRILEATGIAAALEQAGVQEGDTVIIGDVALDWTFDYAPDF